MEPPEPGISDTQDPAASPAARRPRDDSGLCKRQQDPVEPKSARGPVHDLVVGPHHGTGRRLIHSGMSAKERIATWRLFELPPNRRAPRVLGLEYSDTGRTSPSSAPAAAREVGKQHPRGRTVAIRRNHQQGKPPGATGRRAIRRDDAILRRERRRPERRNAIRVCPFTTALSPNAAREATSNPPRCSSAEMAVEKPNSYTRSREVTSRTPFERAVPCEFFPEPRGPRPPSRAPLHAGSTVEEWKNTGTEPDTLPPPGAAPSMSIHAARET